MWWWRINGGLPSDPTRHIAHLTRYEERPAICSLAMLGKLFQVKKLTYRTAPPWEQNFVEQPILLGGFVQVSQVRFAAQLHLRQHSKLGWSPATAEKLFQNHSRTSSLCSTPERVGGMTAASFSIFTFGVSLKAAMYPCHGSGHALRIPNVANETTYQIEWVKCLPVWSPFLVP